MHWTNVVHLLHIKIANKIRSLSLFPLALTLALALALSIHILDNEPFSLEFKIGKVREVDNLSRDRQVGEIIVIAMCVCV